MRPLFSRSLGLPACLGLAAILCTTTAQAQSVRAGTGANNRAGTGTARTGTTGVRSTTTTSSGGNSGGGQRGYRSNTQLGDAIIQIDPETRSIIVVTDEETHQQMERVITDLDRPKPQVLIKVVFLEVTYNKGSDLGVDGSYTFNLGNPVAAQPATSVTNTTGSTANGGTATSTTTTTAAVAASAQTLALQSLFGVASTATQGSFVRVASDNWSATLHALASRGKVEVLSRPSIMARNNQEAVIVVGQEVPFVTNSRTDALGNLTNTIQYDNVGIILRVTPFITSHNSVEMIVAPEISALTAQSVPISSNASAPVISKRSAETVVVTPNGVTAVIGGLMQTQRISSVDKIPILGDIPLLGAAFRHKKTDDVKTELLIFLTPTIINTQEALEVVTAEDTRNTELVKQAFTEQEFDKFFDTLPIKDTAKPVIPALERQSTKVAPKTVAPVTVGPSGSRTKAATTTIVTTADRRVPASTPKPRTPSKKVPRAEDPAAQPPI